MGKSRYGRRGRGRGRGCGCGLGCGCGCCGGGPFAKCGLFTFNTLFLLAGVVAIGLGIWVKSNDNFVSLQHLVEFDSDDKTFTNAGWILLGLGFFVFLVSALGCMSVCCLMQRKCLIEWYTLFLLSLFAIGIAGASVYGIYKGKMDDDMSKSLNKSFENYTPGNKVAKDWDRIQTWLKCCGSKGVHDYMNKSISSTQKAFVPATCCVLRNDDPENPEPVNETLCQSEAQRYLNGTTTHSILYLETLGCYQSLMNIIDRNLVTAILVGVGIALLQILGICLSIGLCMDRMDRMDDNSYFDY